MNILVIGGGLLGRRVAEMLDAAGHDVAVIDESEDNIAQDVYKRQFYDLSLRQSHPADCRCGQGGLSHSALRQRLVGAESLDTGNLSDVYKRQAQTL